MRNKLETYVELLFAGNPEAEEIRQEILQHTLDHYDDLISQGKSPEAAYSLAISGIGDVSELLEGRAAPMAEFTPAAPASGAAAEEKPRDKRLMAIAIMLYILCPVPLFLFQGVAGLCLLLAVVAIATGLMILSGKGTHQKPQTPRQQLISSIQNAVSVGGTVVYLLLSLTTREWQITWLIFPMIGAVNGLIHAIADYLEQKKEVFENEK